MAIRNIAHYEINELIGQGGMGEVYRAHDPKLGRDVAIKVLPPDFARDAERLARFEQEARTVGSLNHPGLVTVFDLGRHEGAPYMVMELIEGETLREKLGAGSTPSGASSPSGITVPGTGLPARKAVEFAIQIARALGAAHDQGVVHRDLKPENVLVTRDGRAKILDFGLAKLTGPRQDDASQSATQAMKTEPGKVMGTVGYMSPEQVRGHETDHRTDIFSLGLLLYEMISGQRAFQAGTSVETMSAILNQDPPALTAASGPRLAPAVERIVRRCLEKEPAQRFQSAHDLAYALDAMQEDSSASMPALDGPAPRRRPATPVWVAALLVLTAAGVWVGRTTAPPAPASDPAARAGGRFVPLSFEPGSKATPGLSPDGRSFIYASSEDGDADILLRRIGGERRVNLTASCEDEDWQPAYSPDGELIAFRSDRDGGGIFVMGATGESARRLTDFGYNPAWSPDGRRIVFNTERIDDPRGRVSVSELWVVDVGTGATEMIYEGDAVEPDWSPDGRRIAFWGLPAGSGDRVIFTIPASGGEATRVFGGQAFNWNPEWTADGRALIFSSDRDGTMDLWRIPVDPATGAPTGPAHPLTRSTEWVAEPGLSSDGDRIVCTTRRERYIISRGRMDGGGWEDLRETTRSISFLAVSPDGRSLTLSGRDGSEDIYVVDVEGGDWRRLTNDAAKDRQPSFDATGERIIFFSDRGGRYELWTIRPDGSGLAQLTELSGENVSAPRPSPDPRWLAVNSATGTALVDLGSGTPVTSVDWIGPTPAGKPFGVASWTPDGRALLGVDGDRTWLFTVEDRSWREVPGGEGDFAGWAPDGGLLRRRGTTLERSDLATGETAAVLELPPHTSRVAVTKDGSQVFVLRVIRESDIWMLELGASE